MKFPDTPVRSEYFRHNWLQGVDVKSKEVVMSQVLESEFKGNAVLVIQQSTEDKFPFQFGVRKARLILSHLEDIKRFVQKHSIA